MKTIFFLFVLFLFTLITNAQPFTDSNIPIVLIDTDINPNTGNHYEILDEPKVLAAMKIIYRPDGSRNYLTDQSNPDYLNYDGRIGIEIRGSSSQVLDKKAYGLTTLENDNVTNNNVSILGMPDENDWILNSIAFDNSLIRNYLSYDLARSIGDYAPRGVYCEVMINGYYQGLYIFMEKIKIDKNRVNIVKMTNTDNNQPDVSGGFITKADKTTGGDPVAWTMESYSGQTEYMHASPKPEDITTQQNNYIKNQFTLLENAMKMQNSSITNGYPSIIDVPIFINYMLISEIASNADSYQYSTYFHKDRNGKLRAGPVWDYDLTYGNDLFFWGLDRSHTNVWQFDNGDNTGSKFWKDLYNNTTFKCYLTKRWKELSAENEPLNYNIISDKIDIVESLITEASVRENDKWGTIGNLATNISNLKSWLSERINWMNGNLNNYQGCASPYIPPIVISRINFNPAAEQGFTSDNLEFIEITNNGNEIVNLTGYYLSELGISYQFYPESIIWGDEKIILASNASAFQQLYGRIPFGQFTRNLSNKSQKLVLSDAFGNIVDSVHYQDVAPWYPEADGAGYFLELKDINSDNSLPVNWTFSSNLTLGVNEFAIHNKVRIFPNPVISNISIESSELKIKSFEIFDLSGKKIIENRNVKSNSYTINIKNLLSNTYILKLNYSDGSNSTNKIFKM